MIKNVIVIGMYCMYIFIACIMCTFSIVMWVIGAYTRVAEAIVVDNISKVFDSIITM